MNAPVAIRPGTVKPAKTPGPMSHTLETPEVERRLAALSAQATSGRWGQYHPYYAPEYPASGTSRPWVADTSHEISAMGPQHDEGRRKLAEFRHAYDAAFAETLVNLYRMGRLQVLDAPEIGAPETGGRDA